MKYEWIFYLISIKLYFGQQLNNNFIYTTFNEGGTISYK